MRAGFVVSSQGPRNEAVLRRFLLKSGVGVLYADEQTTHPYAAVYRQLSAQGTPSRRTICGSQPSSCNIRLSCLPVTPTLTFFLSLPASEFVSSIPLSYLDN
jgi:hypothetical protein